jgi:hypothetical protein
MVFALASEVAAIDSPASTGRPGTPSHTATEEKRMPGPDHRGSHASGGLR